VGLLIRARKRDLLTFQGEMLYQRRDDDTWIALTKNLNTIHALFGRDSEIPGGGEVDPEVGNSFCPIHTMS
jgi:Costars